MNPIKNKMILASLWRMYRPCFVPLKTSCILFHFPFSVGLTSEKLVCVCLLLLVFIFKIQKCGYDYRKWKKLFGIFIFSKYEVSGILIIKWIRVGPICHYQDLCKKVKILKSHPTVLSHFPSLSLSFSLSLSPLRHPVSQLSLSLSWLLIHIFLAEL